jgi:hypothetical protein
MWRPENCNPGEGAGAYRITGHGSAYAIVTGTPPAKKHSGATELRGSRVKIPGLSVTYLPPDPGTGVYFFCMYPGYQIVKMMPAMRTRYASGGVISPTEYGYANAR